MDINVCKNCTNKRDPQLFLPFLFLESHFGAKIIDTMLGHKNKVIYNVLICKYISKHCINYFGTKITLNKKMVEHKVVDLLQRLSSINFVYVLSLITDMLLR